MPKATPEQVLKALENSPAFEEIPASAQKIAVEILKAESVGLLKSTYYKEEYAKIIKKTLDEMLVDNEDRIFYFKSFPKMTPDTLQLMVLHAFKWLQNNEDTSENLTYNRLRAAVKIRPDFELNGITIRFKVGKHLVNAPLGQKIAPLETKDKESEGRTKSWRERLLSWINISKKDDVFEEIFKGRGEFTEEDKLFVDGIFGAESMQGLFLTHWPNPKTLLVIRQAE